ncbi:hypothetical protein [Devosia sp.]|uniref:hypothetical protein n=1 Tax=Devosia sp. TaxID=1871048 RepID=UPI003A95BA5A
MDLLINAANILYVIAYFTTDMVILRVLTMIAASCLALYFGTRPEPMLNVVGWNLFFLGLNGVQLTRLLRSRRRDAASAAA